MVPTPPLLLPAPVPPPACLPLREPQQQRSSGWRRAASWPTRAFPWPRACHGHRGCEPTLEVPSLACMRFGGRDGRLLGSNKAIRNVVLSRRPSFAVVRGVVLVRGKARSLTQAFRRFFNVARVRSMRAVSCAYPLLRLLLLRPLLVVESRGSPAQPQDYCR